MAVQALAGCADPGRKRTDYGWLQSVRDHECWTGDPGDQDQVKVVGGRRDQLAGKIQERYGVAKEEAEKQVTEWERKATDAWFSKDTSDKPKI